MTEVKCPKHTKRHWFHRFALSSLIVQGYCGFLTVPLASFLFIHDWAICVPLGMFGGATALASSLIQNSMQHARVAGAKTCAVCNKPEVENTVREQSSWGTMNYMNDLAQLGRSFDSMNAHRQQLYNQLDDLQKRLEKLKQGHYQQQNPYGYPDDNNLYTNYYDENLYDGHWY